MNSLIPAMPFYPALPSYLGLQNSGNFPRIPWFSRNPAYSILIPGIFQMGFLENLGILGRLPEFYNSK